ncbi:MAG: HAMP domain-containing protein [Rhodocyclales bacterium]|nr:HAMP domain-containing protein [Rhodocyclales bacterium]
MRLPWPRTLFARLMLIWLIGIVTILATSFALFVGERSRSDRSALFEGIAREISASMDVLDHLAANERGPWIEALGGRRLRFSLDARPPENASPVSEHFPLVEALRRAQPDRKITLYSQQPKPGGPSLHHLRLIAILTLSDGTPVSVRLPMPPLLGIRELPSPERILAALAAFVLGLTLLTWFAVRVATRPLSRLAQAANALGEDPNRPALATTGPTEVALAATAFNQMQTRIREHVAERTRILAAISHDLQTPITRLRLRAEEISDPALRTRVQSDLDAMQALAREGLDYARSLDATAPLQAVDLTALVDALCQDAQDMGWNVTRQGATHTPCRAQLVALRRVLWNLIENGIKFGERVEVSLRESDDAIHIDVRDHGPGIAPDELERVFEPFYRTEYSRNRETGGTGLGLAIARNLLRAQGGDVTLENAADGGLIAHARLRRNSDTH